MRLLLWVWLPTRLLIWCRRFVQARARFIEIEPKSFIVYRLDSLGDLILTTPLFRELKRAFPRSRLTTIVQPAYASVLETNPHIDELLTLPVVRIGWLPVHARRFAGALLFYWQEIRHRQFDCAISPRWDTDEHLATFLCLATDARVRIGSSEHTSEGKQRYNHGFHEAFDICLDPGPLQHEVERNVRILEALGTTVHEKRLEIHLSAEDRQYADEALREVPDDAVLIALGIGAQAPGRRWPLECYAAVVRELAMQYPIFTIITCAPSEHAEALRLTAMLASPAFISNSPYIRETCSLLERCDLYLGNDTGAAHLAAAMNCPTIVISRHPRSGDPAHPNSPERFAPWCASSCVLQPDVGLDGCTLRCVRTEPHCIKQVTVSEAVLAAKTVLMRSAPARDSLAMSLSL